MPTTKKTNAKKSTAPRRTVKRTVVRKTVTTTETVRPVAPVAPERNRMIGPFASVRNFILGYFDFLGRSTRSEFWFGLSFVFLVTFAVFALFGRGVVFSVCNILLFIPFVALSARRFQDAGLSVWWYMIPCLLFYLVPVFRAAVWARLMAFNMVSLDMALYSFFAIAFWIFCFVVACLPTRK